MPPADDPLARLHGRASFFDALQSFWRAQFPPRNISSNPTIAGKELDLYMLFEAVRGMGGIDRVAGNHQLPALYDLLHLPSMPPQCPAQLRSTYHRLCLPCEAFLISAVERTYRDTNLHSTTHDWLRARVDISDSPITIHISPQRSSSSDHDPGAVEMKDQQDFLSHPEATQACIRARVRVNALEPCELHHRLFTGNLSHMVHVDLRNHVLRMWYRHTQRRLDVYTALMDVPERFHELGCRVFSYLECTGTINFGAIPLMTPVALRRAHQEGKRDRVAVVGAGISGLIAARQLRSFGIGVTVFEARNRSGGRIRTEKGMFSTGVDMGAMLITGVVQNPVAVVANQVEAPLHFLDTECPLFDIDGTWVSKETDSWAEKEYNAILDATARFRKRGGCAESAELISLGEAFQKALHKRVARRKERIQAYKNEMLKRNAGEETRETGLFDDDIHEEEMLRISPRPRKRRRSPLPRNGGIPQTSSTYSLKSSQCFRSPTNVEYRFRQPGEQQECCNESPDPRHTPERKSPDDHRHRRCMSRKRRGPRVRLLNRTMMSLKPRAPMDDKLISRLLRWHIANLEYACAADINKVSLMHWDQDDPYGFQGEHVLLKSGYEPLLKGLVRGLERNLKYSTEVVSVSYSNEAENITLTTCNGEDVYEEHKFDAVLITVPLGVLKRGSMLFHPPLPSEKVGAISRLGSGGLMKVAMEFTHQFWIENDMFGALRESAEKRGEFYFFWNLVPCTGKSILVAVVAEPSASVMESCPDDEVIEQAMMVLRRCHPEAPDPIAFKISRWSSDPFARGAYTNIPVGSCGKDYDLLAMPVGRVFFAGEHTCRMNPTTCASGLISGLREACRITETLGIVPELARVHSDILREVLDARGESQSTDGNGGILLESPSREEKLSVELMTP